jgi:hypothetical protein
MSRRHCWPAGIQLRPDRRQLVRTSNADRLSQLLHLRNKKKKARIGPQQIESNESSPFSKESGTPRMRTTSEPASHRCVLGFYPGEMEVRVDIYQGYADPPCVSALLCRCSRAEHLIDARQWVKESNLRVSPGSHSTCGCDWSDYSRHPCRSRSSGALFATRRRRRAAGYRRTPNPSGDTTTRGRRAWLHFADRESYAVGLANGASWVPR